MNVNQIYQALVSAYNQSNFNLVLQNIPKVQSQIGVIYEFEFLFGLCALKVGQAENAIQHFKNAKTNKPTDAQATYHLLLALNTSKRYLEATHTAQELDDTNPEHLKLKVLVLQNVGDFEAALATTQNWLNLYPSDEFALRTAASIYRQLGQPEVASKYSGSLKETNIQNALTQSGVAFDQASFEEAEASLLKGLAAAPEALILHETLNQLYWTSGNKDKYMSSFNDVAVETPDILYAQIKSLILSKSWDKAEGLLSQAKQKYVDDPGFVHLEAVVYSQSDRWAIAYPLYEKAAKLLPNNQRFLIDLAVCHIRNSEFNKAETVLNEAQKIDPTNQELWGYLGFVWQQTNQEKFEWLYGKGDLINAQLLSTPKGYKSLETYLADLKDYLMALHITDNTPLDQSVRNGSQTTGNLIYYQHPLIKSFKEIMEHRVNDYIKLLPKDPIHPTRMKLGKGYWFSGSWSVLLKDQGHHANHIHPLGWISGPTYIDIPDQIRGADPTKAGWVKFGETALDHAQDNIYKSICPEPGVSVLFPSFVWHGTYPIKGKDAQRLTISLDVEPLI